MGFKSAYADSALKLGGAPAHRPPVAPIVDRVPFDVNGYAQTRCKLFQVCAKFRTFGSLSFTAQPPAICLRYPLDLAPSKPCRRTYMFLPIATQELYVDAQQHCGTVPIFLRLVNFREYPPGTSGEVARSSFPVYAVPR
jgi:hypothetical protein